MNALHAEIREHIQQNYREVNGITCPWDGSEAKALDKMLKANPSWTVMQWLTMVRNYFDSEGINGQRPRVWLPQISKWAAGPLDKFGHVRRRAIPAWYKCVCGYQWDSAKGRKCPGCKKEL